MSASRTSYAVASNPICNFYGAGKPDTLTAMLVYPQLARHWAAAGIVTCAGTVALAAAVIAMIRHRPSAQEREERRRRYLATHGRIVDGSLIQAEPSEGEPRAVIYRYRIAGVTYECSQDVSALSPPVRNLRLDYPVQVRYNRANPADSIVVAEDWNGLWTNLWTASNAAQQRLSRTEG